MIVASWFAILVFLMLPSVASAHVTFAGAGDLYSGLLHPLTVPAHVLLLLGLGLLAGQQSAPHVNRVLPAFVSCFLLGIIIAECAGIVEISPFVVLSFVTMAGVLVAIDRPMPALLSSCIFGACSLLIGLDSSPGAQPTKHLLLLATGTLIGITLVVVDIAVYSRALRKSWMRIGVRVLGSWIAAGSVMVMALLFR